MSAVILFVFSFLLKFSFCINNGVGWLPVMGWSTWNTFKCNVNSTLVESMADYMVSSGLKEAGYNYLLIDDGWSLCLEFENEEKSCKKVAPRNNSRIAVDYERFPNGMKAVTDYVHAKGLKIGIYTAVSKLTCGGYTGSLDFEYEDASSFAEWGFDFVKHDTCNTDCGIHDGCMQSSTKKMSAALNSTGVPIVYYIDSGNPTSPQRVYNPKNYHVSSEEAILKLATNYSELVWVWAQDVAHMFKSWQDINDHFYSTLDNLHNQIRIAEYQSCGKFNNPDMLTVGQGFQTPGQYRAQFFLWAALGAPLILGADIRTFGKFELDLVMNTEILSINQDSDCTQGSLADASGATETWIKPISSGDFCVVVLNKDTVPRNITVPIYTFFQYGLFFPAKLNSVAIRDLYLHEDLGEFTASTPAFQKEIPSQDAIILLLKVLS